MSFLGTTFTFNGISCEEYDLVLYDVGNIKQDSSVYSSKIEIDEDRIASRYKSLHYGIKHNQPLEFNLVCCVDEERAETGTSLDRWEMERISSWLTGFNQYKWLKFDQEDLENVRYRCIIKDLKMIEVFGDKVGVQFTVVCDSPYAYLMPESFTYHVEGSSNIIFRNRSSMNAYYYPRIIISDASNVEIKNITDSERIFALSQIPLGDVVTIDNENGIITSSSGINMYTHFNFNFMRLKRGDNIIKITGDGTYVFECEFPVNVGG